MDSECSFFLLKGVWKMGWKVSGRALRKWQVSSESVSLCTTIGVGCSQNEQRLKPGSELPAEKEKLVLVLLVVLCLTQFLALCHFLSGWCWAESNNFRLRLMHRLMRSNIQDTWSKAWYWICSRRSVSFLASGKALWSGTFYCRAKLNTYSL